VLTQRGLATAGRRAPCVPLHPRLEVLPLWSPGSASPRHCSPSLDRRREMALLRATGATRRQVAAAVVAEAAGVGAVGWIGGVAMGAVLSLLWVRVNFTVQLGWDLDFHFAFASLPTAALAALLVSVPAGLLPAWRVARLPVVAALREE
jgi:putative ABC transport system permease protein